MGCVISWPEVKPIPRRSDEKTDLKMESTWKTVKNSVFFFFFFIVRSTVAVNGGSQRRWSTVKGSDQCWRGADALGLTSLCWRQHDVTRADVALADGENAGVATLVGAWKPVRAWLENQRLLAVREARARPDPTDFGGNEHILMRSI